MNDSSHPSIGQLIRVFGNLPRNCLLRLQEIFFVKHYRSGEAIFLQGDRGHAIYFTMEGRVKIERVSPEGHPCILCMRSAGETFCPVPLLDRGAQLGTAWAVTDVTLFWGESRDFNAVAQNCPALLSVVQQGCLMEVRRVLGRMELVAFRPVKERVAVALLDELQRQAYVADDGVWELRITQQELAGLVGASRESVSRALARLEDKGLVETLRGRVLIRNRAGLEQIANR